MKRSLFSKVLFLGISGIFTLLIGAETTNAASFEDMKENIEAGNGQIINLKSNQLMTEESSQEFISLMEQKMESKDLSTEEIPPEIWAEVEEETKELESIVIEEDVTSLVSPIVRGASVPAKNKTTALDGYSRNFPYTSNQFSAKGMRYGETNFKFNNYKANPSFGACADKDSFYLKVRGANSNKS